MGWVLKSLYLETEAKTESCAEMVFAEFTERLEKEDGYTILFDNICNMELCLKIVIPITENKSKCSSFLSAVRAHRTGRLLT